MACCSTTNAYSYVYWKAKWMREQLKSAVLGPTWRLRGGTDLEPLFEHCTLVDVRWLLSFAHGEVMPERKGVVPAWQNLPDEAKASVERLRKSTCRKALPIGVLSYGWSSRSHPDTDGKLLRRLIPCLEALVAKCERGEFGRGGTFGIVWDFMSLPQRGYTSGYNPDEDDRTPAQLERFSNGLQSINQWYGHPRTHSECRPLRVPRLACLRLDPCRVTLSSPGKLRRLVILSPTQPSSSTGQCPRAPRTRRPWSSAAGASSKGSSRRWSKTPDATWSLASWEGREGRTVSRPRPSSARRGGGVTSSESAERCALRRWRPTTLRP